MVSLQRCPGQRAVAGAAPPPGCPPGVVGAGSHSPVAQTCRPRLDIHSWIRAVSPMCTRRNTQMHTHVADLHGTCRKAGVFVFLCFLVTQSCKRKHCSTTATSTHTCWGTTKTMKTNQITFPVAITTTGSLAWGRDFTLPTRPFCSRVGLWVSSRTNDPRTSPSRCFKLRR